MQFDTRSLWIYLHFPRLQLDVIEQGQKAESASIDEPRGIYETQENQIVQVNKSAHQRGIKTGMGLASASLLYPDLILHEYRAEVEQNTLEHLANSLYLVTSDIVLSPPNGIILRAQNMLKLYGGLDNYWACIQRCIEQYNYHFTSASAFSIQAAKLMAKQGLGFVVMHSENKDVNQNISQRAMIEQVLKTCQLTYSDIQPKDLEKLKRIGIHRVADLDTLPLSELANRVTRHSLGIISELRGQAPSKVTFFKPLTRYDDYIELMYEISLSDKLLPVIAHALEKLSHFLYVRNAHCISINIDFHQREHKALNIIFNSALPIYQSKEWLDIIALKMERITFSSPIYAIALHCPKHEEAHSTHDDFFTRKSTHVAAMSLLSRLSSKLGSNKLTPKVSGLKFVNDFRPEAATEFEAKHQAATVSNKVSIFADRPGLLLKHPELLQHKIKVIKGPERIVSGWWDNHKISRDYYIGQNEQGQQIWVFKTPEQKWYLHGYFV
ncbi:Y-family DNA polymerase [Ningiella sp. W23]|uniref:Y-family DNA polymerase n=1 Tax=Ningiella sp. W23 TaxID=3023715 RepID=UPI0037580F64